MQWTADDQIRAEAFRLGRIRSHFSRSLGDCFLHLSQENALNVHAAKPETVDLLVDKLEDLAWYTWLFTGATKVALWFYQEEILSLPTQPETALEWKLFNSIQSSEEMLTNEEFDEMTTATLSPTPAAKSLIPARLIAGGRTQLKRLETVAGVMNLSVEQVEQLCEERSIELQIDEDGNSLIRLEDAAAAVSAAAIAKLSAPRAASERNGNSNGTMVAEIAPAETIAQPQAEAPAEPQRQSKATVELPDNFKVHLSDAKRTAMNALEVFARTPKRRRQIANAIANKTQDGLKYIKALQSRYPTERWEKDCDKLMTQFKKLAQPPSEAKDMQAAS